MSSCVFTFGESSVWDPKVVREYLDIPEDQLDILRNLPEWSKSRHNDNACRIEKDTCENSQPSQLIPNVTLERNEKLITQNRVLFDDSFEIRKSILETYKLKSKLFRSYSLFEIDRISNSSFYSDHLRSTLSVPNICQFAENLHPKIITSELRKRDPLGRNLLALNIDKPVYKESEKACITENTDKDTLELEKNKEKIYSEKSSMEVDAQLPITVPCIQDQVKNNETNIEILGGKVVTTNHTLNSPNKQSALLTSPNKFQNSISDVIIKDATLTTTDNIKLCEKNLDIDIENMPSKSFNQEESETSSKNVVMKSGSPNSCGKNEPVLNSIEKTHMDADITKENKEVETNMNLEVPSKANKTSDHGCESNDISKELPSFKASLVSSNEPAIKIPCNSSLSKVTVENGQLGIHNDISDNKPFADTLSAKRKLESKGRSKKRRKQGYEERSIKKAGDICYSVEHIKTMLDIMKQFI